MLNSNKCNGVVTSKLMGIAIVEYGHSDGTICVRPHADTSLAIGTLVESEFQNDGLCEHRIVAIHNVSVPEEKPPLTVADILQARANVPDDGPASAEIVARAKIPPPIRRDPSTAPARDMTNIPVENRYEFDLTEDELQELNAVRHDEPITGGKPVSPFSGSFDPLKSQQPSEVKRKPRKPMSVFDLK